MKMKHNFIAFIVLTTALFDFAFCQSRFWIITCNSVICRNAINSCLEANCYGRKSCQSIFDINYPECKVCFYELLDENDHETINGSSHLVCVKEDELQAKGCMLYCRVNFYSSGECVRQNNVPICKCTSTEPLTVTQTSATSVTSQSSASSSSATTVVTSLSTATSSFTTSSAITTNYLYNNLRLTLKGHTNWVTCIALLPNGDLASGSSDKTIKIWDLKNGLLKKELIPYSSTTYSLLVLPNGDLLSAFADGKFGIWDPVEGVLKTTMSYGNSPISGLKILSNGEFLSWAGYFHVKVNGVPEKAINIWNANDLKLKKTIAFQDAFDLAILPNGNLASASNINSTVFIAQIWNITDGTLKFNLTGHSKQVYSIAALPNGDIATGSEDCTIKIWSSTYGTLKKNLVGHTQIITALTVLPNGNLASASDDLTIKIWNPYEGILINTIRRAHNSTNNGLFVLPNGELVSYSFDSTIKIWN